MSELQQEFFEKQLVSIARELDYPRTPDIAGAVMKSLHSSPLSPLPEGERKRHPRVLSRPFGSAQGKLLAWSLAVLLILFSSLMLIPPARAAIIEFIQVGVVRIFRAEPTPVAPPNEEFPATMVPVTATPGVTSEPLIPILEGWAGEMTLEEAQQTVGYPILLPSYPPDLGRPDRVFVQEAEGKLTILVWLDPQVPEHIRMSFHLIPPRSWAVDKFDPALVQETKVKGQDAIWAVGPYPIRFSNGNLDFIRLIDGHVLIWADDGTFTPGGQPGSPGMTYRLETDESLEEAIRIAESLEPIR